MTIDDSSSIQTRPSLLNRLKEGDIDGWNEFYRVYGKIVRDFSIKAGLSDTQADEVVQETAIAVARHLPEFAYDPKTCRFKTWLLNQTTWRIKDHLRKCRRSQAHAALLPVRGDATATSPVNSIPDPAPLDFADVFESEWRKNLFDSAFTRVKKQFSPKQIQIFDLVVLQEWPTAEAAKSLGVSLANIYVSRHRVSAAVKREAKRLELEFERVARVAASAK